MTERPQDPAEGSTAPGSGSNEGMGRDVEGRSFDRFSDSASEARSASPNAPHGDSASPASSTAGPVHPSTAAYTAPNATSPYPTAQPAPEHPAFQRPSSAPDANTSAPYATAAPGSTGTPAKRKSGPLILAGLAIGALVGGAAGAGVTTAMMAQDDDRTPVSSSDASGSARNIVVNDPEDATIITAVAEETLPSVVTIAVAGAQRGGTGSGVILSEDGYVLTNTHVVTLDGETGSAQVQVTTSDGRNYLADIVGTDPIADLAVVKLRDASGLPPITWADSSELNVGEMAIAIGAPLGLSGTVTNGIVSALNRSIQVASSAAPEDTDTDTGTDSGQTPFDFWEFGDQAPTEAPPTQSATISLSVIQTDAAINPGNSGGALLDSDGRLIGVNVAIASAGGAQSSSTAGSIGVGFAIPSNYAERIANELIATGQASHGLLGAAVSDADPDGNPLPVAGTYIARVTGGGAAEAAGLRAGDIVTAIGGVSVASSSDLTAQVRVLEGGAETEITYVRDGEENTVPVTLGEL
ncbi:trypsin-like peptidase domain-containing protein [Planctomonas psychrotolerans]|uniref:trypsin-like peptidase domain-containing protein n=1 Tax=Planctomonas psychrotolerans TaxID=2528712 RepID=UPI0029D41B0F|nr:trypsin-like peptidase domain-containing protein [Planctomonas psychrotolerans]